MKRLLIGLSSVLEANLTSASKSTTTAALGVDGGYRRVLHHLPLSSTTYNWLVRTESDENQNSKFLLLLLLLLLIMSQYNYYD